MKRRLRTGLLLAAGVALVACLALAAWSGTVYAVLPESHVIVERLMGGSPERRVSAYLGAIARQDRQGALAAWPRSCRSVVSR